MTDSEVSTTPRHMRTPITAAGDVVRLANEKLWSIGYYANYFGLVEFKDSPVEPNFFSEMSGDEDVQDNNDFQTRLDLLLNQAVRMYRAGDTSDICFYPLAIAVLYAKEGLRIYESGNKDIDSNNLVWSYIADAQYWLGKALSSSNYILDSLIDKKGLVEKMASIRHAETRGLEKDVLEYYEANKDKFTSISANKAAAAIIEAKLVPLEFTTVRDYIRKYRKKNKHTSS